MAIRLAAKCICVIVLLQSCNSITAIPLEEFYDYGPCFDRFLPPKDDISRRIRLSVPINFYGAYTCSIGIFDDGYASFLPKYPYVPLRLPSEIPFPFIAPFQSDIDIRYPRMKSDALTENDSAEEEVTTDEDFMDLDLFDVTESFDEAIIASARGRDERPMECDCLLPEAPPADYCEEKIIVIALSDFPPDCPCFDIPIRGPTLSPITGRAGDNEMFECNPIETPPVVPPTMRAASAASAAKKRKVSTRICPPPGRVWYRESTDPVELCRAQREVKSTFEGVDDFTPKSLVIATWDHVGSFRRRNRRTNTFQLIIASDGNVSFAIFLYADDEMQWSIPFANGLAKVLLPRDGPLPFGGPPPDGPTPDEPPSGVPLPIEFSTEGGDQLPPSGAQNKGGPPPFRLQFLQRFLRGPRATAGINAGDLHRFQRTSYHESAQIVNIDQTSNVDIPGVWMFKLDGEVEVGLTQTQLTVVEDREGRKGKRRPSFVEICLRVSRPGMIGLRPLQFELTTIGGTATESNKTNEGDFRITRFPIRMFGESVIECTNILIVPDDIHEGIEDFTISVSQRCPCGRKANKLPPFLQPTPVTISPAVANIRIVDNDDITVGILETVIDVFEDDESGNPQILEVCATVINGTLVGSLDVVLTTVPGSAFADEDYCSDSITVTIDDGDNDIACAEFSTKHDTDDEGEEEFFVEFSLPRPEPGVIIAPDLQVATVTILDNEFNLTIEQDATDIVEDNGFGFGTSVTICARLTSGFIFVPISVMLRTLQQGSASSDIDFNAMEQTVTLTNTNTMGCASFSTIPDNLFEETEVFFVGLFPPQTAVVDLDPSSVAISIIDNDDVTVGLVETLMLVPEEAGASATLPNQIEICAQISGGVLQSSLTFLLSVTSDVAREEFDFELLETEIIVAASEEDNECGLVVTVPDPILESDEEFQINIVVESGSAGQIVVNPDTAIIRIMDNDDIQIGFEESVVEIQEDDGSGGSVSAMLCAVIITGAIETLEFSLTVTPTSGTAVQGIDFIGGVQILTLNENTDRDCATFTTIPNVIPQTDREFTLQLGMDDGTSSAISDVLLQPSVASVVIFDNDDVSVAFEMSSYNMTEDDGSGQGQTVMPCVEVLNDDIEVSVDVLLEINPGGTAILGSDYSGDNSVTLTLDSDNLRQCTTYTTIADTDIEEDESFIATLSSVDIRVVLTNPVETTVNIIDNDFGLERTVYTEPETSPSVEVCAVVASESVRNAIRSGAPVTLMTVDGTAEDGSDYTASSATLSFDTMMQCLEVPLIDNSVVEDEESFSVMITNTPAMLTASPSSTSVIIEDDDLAEVSLVVQSGAVNADRVLNEDSGDFEICAVLTGDIDQDVITRLVITSGSGSSGARFGQDFEVEDNRATHELTFSPGGDTTECVDVTINDDSRTESLEETFPFSLVQRDSQATLGEPNSGTITIIDNDRECRFNFCLNSGSCELDPVTNDSICICAPSFTGQFCELST